MPKTDWQALDARIAREIMLCMKWDELSEGALKIYWETMDERPTPVFLAHNRKYWWFLDESGCPDSTESLKSWQPHLNVTQALKAADALMSKFLDVRYVLEYTRSGYWCILRNLPAIGSHHTSQGATLAKAICLALEAWLDAQKEKQDDPG